MPEVCILGGGPAGATAATYLRKFAPDWKVTVLEREKFPRDHIGESLLPPVCYLLDEMDAWDKVEAADFPIKIGATFRWGQSDKLWDFSFLGHEEFDDKPRPGRFKGQRRFTAFQVDRSVFDKILLDHAAELGATVREETPVKDVVMEGDRIVSVQLANGEEIKPDYVLDCTGNAGFLRRKLDIGAEEPPSLRNIAIWDYWQNAEWAVTLGTGGTRILVMSVDFGWLWFIPISPTRTSLGLVVPAEYYKSCGLDKEVLYRKAIDAEPTIRKLVENATPEGKLEATKDWSHICDRLTGENWFMVGECAGFADPILSAGLTLAMTGAREAVFSLLELERGEQPADWLKASYEENQKSRIGQHIRFANFWYAGNGIFTDLQKYTTEIAKASGLELDPGQAFRWLGTGGFAQDDPGLASVGVFSVAAIKEFAAKFFPGQSDWKINEFNEFRLDIHGAERVPIPVYTDGRVIPVLCYRKEGKALPMHGLYRVVTHALGKTHKARPLLAEIRSMYQGNEEGVGQALEVLEAMVETGWVKAKFNKKEPNLRFHVAGSIRETSDVPTA